MSNSKHNQKISKLYPAFRLGVTLLLIGTFALSGCNFPQPTAVPTPQSEVHQTEVAGILNPTDFVTPPVLNTPTPAPPPAEPESAPPLYEDGYITYTTQPGDTLSALASRFGVATEAIKSELLLPEKGLLPIGVPIQFPDVLEVTLPYTAPIFPDTEVIYGPGTSDFNAVVYAAEANGFLTTYSENVKGEILYGHQIVQRVATETSTNPRLLLSFLEYQSGWVFGYPPNAASDPYPIGYGATLDTGLYKELMITARLLAEGFYGWRDGSRLEINFYGGGTGRISPSLNAGSASLMRLFASIYPYAAWETHLFGATSFLLLHQEMFGDYWARAAAVQPYLLDTTSQPDLMLPFNVGEAWSLTGGPHITWQTGTPRGAVDFAPITGEPHCAVSGRWATAAAPGLVVRSDNSVVAIDIDGDGDEGTGWVLIYQHMAEQDRVPVGVWLEQDDNVGHPSCEGGQASGTHIHFARKFNGEWIGVGEPLPLILSGWLAVAGEGRYEGYLQKGDQIVTNKPDGSYGSTIIREN